MGAPQLAWRQPATVASAWRWRQAGQFQVLHSEGDADDGEGTGDGRAHMAQRQPQAGEHEPQHIAHRAQRAGAHVALPRQQLAADGLLAEGEERELADHEGRTGPGNAHDGDEGQQPEQPPAQAHEGAAEDEPEEVADAAHGMLPS
jgi:hypothetical protein